jgi:hypothetical protein
MTFQLTLYAETSFTKEAFVDPDNGLFMLKVSMMLKCLHRFSRLNYAM